MRNNCLELEAGASDQLHGENAIRGTDWTTEPQKSTDPTEPQNLNELQNYTALLTCRTIEP
uniref:Uncharacterized protein n=1 Tax=Anguilla anguilla TaxID=7936 RepID=A0A0E9U3A9_ANGAN